MFADFTHGCAQAAAVILTVAAGAKARDLASSRATLVDLLPRLRNLRSARLQALIWLIVGAEATIALLLAAAPTSLLTVASFSCVAAIFLITNGSAYRRKVACGCFGLRTRRQSRSSTIIRTALMSGLALALITVSASRLTPAGRFSSMSIASMVVFGLVFFLNEHRVGPTPGRGRVFRDTTCPKQVGLAILSRLRNELARTLSVDAIDHADLAWWAADINQTSSTGAASYVVAVPGSGGRLNAVVPTKGTSRILLITPKGPIAGATLRLNNQRI